jgi:hypothetical protein
MMVINASHHDLEIVYGIRYRNWLTANSHNLTRASEYLQLALNNLVDAGYTPEVIALIERHNQMILERANVEFYERLDRPQRIVFVDIGDDDTEPLHGIDLRDLDNGGTD